MAVPATLRFDIIADAKKATTAMGKVGDTAKTTGGRLSGMAGAIGGALAVGAVVNFGKAAVTAAEESASATAGLEQVFKQMGDTTGSAAQAAVDYAGSMSKKIGVDDDAIISAQIYAAHAGTAISAARKQEHLETAMQSRHTIGVAQGLLMQRYGISEAAAFQVLSRQSQEANVKLREVAKRVVDLAHAEGGRLS